MTSKSSPPPSRVKTKSPTSQSAKQQSVAPVRLKSVVRRLPPNLPEPVFWQSVESWVSDETVSWKAFYQGKLRKKLNKENIPSRAYILFKNEEHLAVFSRDYDGHLFRDKQGNESQAVVEFAPNQKVPPEKKKIDSRHATIQQDEDYLSFVASLQNPPAKAVEVDLDALLAATQPPEEPKTTPLLAALREQKQSAQEKKLAAAEAAKAHSRKGAAAAAAQKLDVEEAAPPAAKRSRRGRGNHAAAATAATTAAAAAAAPSGAANPPSTKSSGGSRNRPNAPVTSGPSAPTTSTTTGPGESEASQKRNRPMLGLQSRHLKAALTGAGVAVAPTSPSGVAPALTAPAAAGSRSGGGAPRGGGGGEKRSNEKAKDGAAKGPGGGRGGGGGGKDKARSRHPAGAGGHGPPAGPSRATDAPPRILSRQDSSVTAVSGGDAPARDRAPPEGGGGRGRGGRRGRGQP